MWRILRLVLAALPLTACAATGRTSNMDTPPVPWTPVVVSNRTEVSVWGRTYCFDRGPLPVQVLSTGESLLAAPVRLDLDEDAVIEWERPRMLAHAPTRVELTCAGRSSGIRWAADATLTYDGLAWVTLRAHADQAAATIGRLSLVVPMVESQATLYSRHFSINEKMSANWRASFYKSPENLWAAGRTPEGGWAGEFTSQLWLGSYGRGLAFYAETPEAWSIDDDDRVMVVTPPRDGRVDLRVHFALRRFSPGKEWQIDFGLMATPVRPAETRPEAFRAMHTGGYDPLAGYNSAGRADAGAKKYPIGDIRKPMIDKLAQDGVEVVLLWNKWSNHLGFPDITDPAYLKYTRDFVAYAHGRGMKVVPYCSTLGMFVSTHPEFETMKDRFTVDGDYWKDPFSKAVESRIYRVVPTEAWTEWYVAKLTKLARETGIDGVYLDTIHKADVPMQETRVKFELRLWRNFYERLYRVFHGEVVENGYVYLHDSDPNLFILNAFGDLRLTGEMQYYSMATGHRIRSKMPDLCDRMPLDEFYVWSSGFPLGGVPATWTWKSLDRKHFSVGADLERQAHTIADMIDGHELFALTGLFNMHPSLSPNSPRSPLETLAAIWALENEMRPLSPIWFGYWDAARYIRPAPTDGVAAAGFVAPGRKVLLHVVNLRSEARDVVAQLQDATALAHTPLRITGHVMGTGSSAEAGEGLVRVRVTPNSFARVMLEPVE